MRAGLFAVVVGFVLVLAPSAQAGMFGDLPGMKMAEQVAANGVAENDAPSAGKSKTVVTTATEDARVSAPEPKSIVAQVSKTKEQQSFVDVPGTSIIPVIGELKVNASARRGSPDALYLLAALACVLFTRFLVRLNSV